MRYEVLTALKMSTFVFWIETASELVGRHQRFRGTHYLHLLTSSSVNRRPASTISYGVWHARKLHLHSFLYWFYMVLAHSLNSFKWRVMVTSLCDKNTQPQDSYRHKFATCTGYTRDKQKSLFYEKSLKCSERKKWTQNGFPVLHTNWKRTFRVEHQSLKSQDSENGSILWIPLRWKQCSYIRDKVFWEDNNSLTTFKTRFQVETNEQNNVQHKTYIFFIGRYFQDKCSRYCP
jgi:hypothetical protein